MGMESAGFQSKSGQCYLFAMGGRFRAGRAAHSESAKTSGRNSGSYRASQSKIKTLTKNLYRDCDRADPRRSLISAGRSFALAESGAAGGKESRTNPRKNGQGTGRLQNVVAKRF